MPQKKQTDIHFRVSSVELTTLQVEGRSQGLSAHQYAKKVTLDSLTNSLISLNFSKIHQIVQAQDRCAD